MPIRSALNNCKPSLVLTFLLIAMPFVGCVPPHAEIFHPISPVSNALSMGVWLEDRCESQGKDETTITLLEALHDGVILPMEMLVAVGAVTIVSAAWSLYDRLVLPSGIPLPNRPEVVMAYVMPHRVGPVTRNTRDVHNIPVAWFGCLAYDDG